MKTILAALIAGLALAAPLLAQLPPPGGPRGGFPGFPDSARRTEMLADRIEEDLGLNRDQRREILAILDQTQTATKGMQEELQTTRKTLVAAIRTGKTAPDLDPLHQQIGTLVAKLTAMQSAAFAEALKVLKDDQKADADILYEVLGMVAGSGGRPMRGGPGGPDGFRNSGHGPREPGGPPRK